MKIKYFQLIMRKLHQTDSSNKLSKKIAFEVMNLLSSNISVGDKIPAQSLGIKFEKGTAEFIKNTFPLLKDYRHGN